MGIAVEVIPGTQPPGAQAGWNKVMGAFWSSLGVIGLLFPVLILAGTAAYVLKLGRKLRRLDPDRMRRPVVPVVWHVGLVLAVDVCLEFVSSALFPRLPPPVATGIMFAGPVLRIASLAVVPCWLHRRLRTLTTRSTRADQGHDPTPEHGKVVRMAWMIIISGILLPWLVALAVKLYLSALDRPTLPYSSFLNPFLPALLVATLVQWSFPFVILAWIVRYRIMRPGKLPFPVRWSLVRIVHVTGLAFGVLLFWGIFWEFDYMYLFVPLGLFLVPPMFVAYEVARRYLGRTTRVPSSLSG